ncbi:haloacid dehalogenase superfamily, subfamily IA, variant 3 with third motif having DD or ED [Amycolatopsis sacchari]|uniref:Haloacid dehalogenase superfamily, subfamily IA, variant 3 with third motif having DD or ED n=1 Tax=Amycolatopsis sacchari TaxID=115433 RepID=A0A1I3ZZA9_9PSEU|nr:HAD-IA family hydrolase [Amycolatopsis sacchari]SFK49051.1 haloacid dehalogenase superfamily, subfamily IA, variant 3 with third motif having DD or ED [Amycolatopsis sacchari]
MLSGLVVDYAGVLTDPDAADLFTTIDRLRERGVRTALLSNAAGGGTAKARLGRWFDALVFSGEVGHAKPSPQVYLLTADRLGLPATACVFVDDSRRNVDGAVEAGMVGVHHTSVPATLTELAALFPA